jgi:hypothetical protein
MIGIIVFMLINISIIEDLLINFTIFQKNAKFIMKKQDKVVQYIVNIRIQHLKNYITLILIKLKSVEIFLTNDRIVRKENYVHLFMKVLKKDLNKTEIE